MNLKLKEVFKGKVVNKAHTINTGVDEFPRYVLEYLIDNYKQRISRGLRSYRFLHQLCIGDDFNRV